MVFLDLSKAFDTINHDIMLHKLLSLGSSDSAVVWFKSYLSNRTQSICVNGVLSEPQSIQFGVPQGSLLGPLLFLVYINDMCDVSKVLDFFLFVDDTNIFFLSSKFEFY